MNIILKNIVCIIIGALLLSPLANYVFVNIVGFSHAYIEILIFPIYVYLIFKYHIKYKLIDIILGAFLLFLLTIIGLLDEKETFYSILSSLRCLILFLITYFTFKSKPILSYNDLYYISLGIIIGSSVLSLINFQNVENLEGTGFSFIVNITLISIPIFISISYIKNNFIHFFIDVLLVCFASALSVTRGFMLFTILSIVITLLLSLSLKRIIVSVITLILSSFIFYQAYLNAESYINDMSPTIHNRLYSKVRGESTTGDNDRIEHVLFIIYNLPDYILPRGLTTHEVKLSWYKTNRAKYMIQDFSFSEIFYIFGIFTIYIVYKYIFKLYLYFRKSKIFMKDRFFTINGIMIIFFMFFGYGLISQAYSICFLSIFLSLYYNPNCLLEKT